MPAGPKGAAWYLARVEAKARKRGGECLSPKYLGANTMLCFRCASGHVWDTTPLRVNVGNWCPKCFRERRKIGIDRVRAIAHSKRGECLSATYVDAYTKLSFRCTHGHQFSLEPRRFSEG